MELDRMFAEAPAFADGHLFAARVEAALDRGWTFRQLVIGGLGIAGGLIGGAQILGSGLVERLSAATAQSNQLANHLLSSRLAGLATARILPAGTTLDGGVVWMSAALAIVALGYVVTRAIREI